MKYLNTKLKFWTQLSLTLSLMLASNYGHAALTDIKFGQSQVADSQWNVNACLNTTTCQIYSKNPGTAYKIPWTSGQVQWAAGDYIKFELSNDSNFPYIAKQYDSLGNLKATLGTGKIVNMGPDYFFFVGNDNDTGQLFSGSSGMSNTSGVTWTGTLNPTIAQADTYANATYSTVPLSSGQTATVTPSSSSPPPPATTCNPCSPNTNNPNLGFEAGNTTNWTVSNGSGGVKTTPWSSNGDGVTVSTGMTNYQPGGGKTWTVKPYGTYMMAIQAGGGSPTFDTAMGSLGLNSTELNSIKNYLTGLGGNSNPTNASWAKREVTLQAGVTYTIAWQYMSTDYVPFNDGSIMTLVHSTDASKTPTLNNGQKRYALLGFTNPGTGNYSTDSYGATGWQLATITVPVDGVYILGFGSFNLGDTALSPILFIDDLQGTTELNGQPFNPVPPNQGSDAPVTGGGGSAPTWPESDGISTNQLNNKNSAKSRVANIQLGNYIDLEVKVGSSNNSVTMEQSGSFNKIAGLGGSTYAIIDGDNNNINVKQGSVIGKNLIEFSVVGNSNNVTLWQARNETTGMGNASDSGMHYTGVNMNGNSNTLSVKQSNSGGSVSGHFAYIDITGNSNQSTLKQSGNNEKTFFGVVGGSNNVFDVTQMGTGSHFFDINISGNGNTLTGVQKDSAAHKATVNLINIGGVNTVNLTQQGSTAQSINITQACANLSGCSVTVTQGNP